MKLKNGWLHKKNYIKALVWSGIVLAAGIGFCCYEIFAREAKALIVIMYAILFFLIASVVFTSFYSKEMKEFGDKVNEVYMSMDPKPFYDYINQLDLDILHDETKTKIAFFTAWFYHFEGRHEEAREMFYAKAVKPFPYPNMLSLKSLIEIYLLEDKNEGYTVVKNTLKELEETKLNPKMKQQLENEIKGQVIRLDAITSGEASDDIIESLKGSVAQFEYVQNQCFLAYLLKTKDPHAAYEAKKYVLENYGNFPEYKNIAEKIEIDFDPVKWAEEHPVEEVKEVEETPENDVVENTEVEPVENTEVEDTNSEEK